MDLSAKSTQLGRRVARVAFSIVCMILMEKDDMMAGPQWVWTKPAAVTKRRSVMAESSPVPVTSSLWAQYQYSSGEYNIMIEHCIVLDYGSSKIKEQTAEATITSRLTPPCYKLYLFFIIHTVLLKDGVGVLCLWANIRQVLLNL
jgi:hypothetical protein